MSNNKSNTENLHEAGIINKDDLDKEHIEAIDTLSQEEVDNLKSIDKSMKKSNQGVGVFL
jgi:hypothetical protein